MKFSVNRILFLENLNIISRALPSKTPMVILQAIKFQLDDNDLIMTASNTEISVLTKINKKDLTISQRGNCVVPGKYFIEFVRKITSNMITITLIDDKLLTLESDKGEYSFRVDDYDDYPSITFEESKKHLILEAKYLKDIIKQTTFACGISEKKPLFTGVNIKKENDMLISTGTDSFRLSQAITPIDSSYDDFEIVVPSRSLDDLYKSLTNDNDEIQLHINENKVLFKFNNILIQTRLLDGNYPNTSRLIADSFNIEVSFDKDELLESVERVSLLSPKDKERNELTYSIIKLEIKNDKKIELSSKNTLIGEAKEVLISTNDNYDDTISINFSSKHIIEALRVFTSKEVVLHLVNNYRSFIVRSSEYNSNPKLEDNLLTQLILPVRSELE